LKDNIAKRDEHDASDPRVLDRRDFMLSRLGACTCSVTARPQARANRINAPHRVAYTAPRTNQGQILDSVLDSCNHELMSKVTGKFQITLPKAIVDRCRIRVGDELELRAMGRAIQIDRRMTPEPSQLRDDRLAHFDRATTRQRIRERTRSLARTRSRGWTRAELYVRGRTH